MEIEKLSGIVLLFVMVGMVLGVGILVHDKFGEASKEKILIEQDTFVWTTSPVSNVSLSHGNLTSLLYITNATGTGVCPTGNYTVFLDEGLVYTYGNSSQCNDTMTVNATYYYYEYETATKDVMSDIVSAESAISTSWLSLLITIIILGIIMTLVIRSFVISKR